MYWQPAKKTHYKHLIEVKHPRKREMMEFSELYDEIGADDWLISSDEITRRRLVRRTPRYNIYKADWFGDVLVYEPRDKSNRNKLDKPVDKLNSSPLQQRKPVCLVELSARLNNLNLQQSPRTSGFEDGHWSSAKTTPDDLVGPHQSEQQTDSAYSSISSTPQHHTKSHGGQNEFEFPGPTKLTCGSYSPTPSKKKDVCEQHPAVPVILNKDSYMFNYDWKKKESIDEDQWSMVRSNQSQMSTWFELNELRLVAHESFMLFMGASPLNSSLNEEPPALVMQMNHPKAVSLYNLLHGHKLTNTSPIDRFFASKRQQLGLGLKFNICQQVTNAMTYLHDKNIVHGKLTSVNIYLELNQRVKISLLDNDESPLATTNTITGQHQFNLPALTHLSPELVRSIKLVTTTTDNCDNQPTTHVQIDPNQLTKMADVFSFGTLLFELFEEQFPFSDELTFDSRSFLSHFESPHLFTTPTSGGTPTDGQQVPSNWNGNITASVQELIFQIGSGLMGERNLNKQTNRNRCPALVRDVISLCWNKKPTERPTLKYLSTLF